VPELAAGAAAELDGLRHACDLAVARLREADTDALVTLGADGRAHHGFAPWGVEVRTGGGIPLPLSLLVGDWLLARHGWQATERMAVPGDAPTATCAAKGVRLAADGRRLALLVLGDGSYRRGERAPGYHDPRAAPYDRAVADALAAADTEALLGLDPALSTELGAAGRAAWQVLASAVHATGGRWDGELHYDAAPYGVAYFVASWRPS
jgi:hypothetical protein